MAILDKVANGTKPHREPLTVNSNNQQQDHDAPSSPLRMPPGQIDGLASLHKDMDMRGPLSPQSEAGSLLSLRIPGISSSADLALSAMQYLPTPLLVLSSLKTVVLANESMGRFLGLNHADEDSSDDGRSFSDVLRGKTLSQIGVDMVVDGHPVWVTWETFLDSLLEDLQNESQSFTKIDEGGDITPTVEKQEPMSRRESLGKYSSVVHDTVVEVVVTPDESVKACKSGGHPELSLAKMIITIWEMEGSTFYTLTFTSTDSGQTSLPSSRGNSRTVMRPATHHGLHSMGSGSGTQSSPSSISSGRSSHRGSSSSSNFTSPTVPMLSTSAFPPLGPPSHQITSVPSALQKITLMKDALLDSNDLVILAMWKDESMVIPNKGGNTVKLGKLRC